MMVSQGNRQPFAWSGKYSSTEIVKTRPDRFHYYNREKIIEFINPSAYSSPFLPYYCFGEPVCQSVRQ